MELWIVDRGWGVVVLGGDMTVVIYWGWEGGRGEGEKGVEGWVWKPKKNDRCQHGQGSELIMTTTNKRSRRWLSRYGYWRFGAWSGGRGRVQKCRGNTAALGESFHGIMGWRGRACFLYIIWMRAVHGTVMGLGLDGNLGELYVVWTEVGIFLVLGEIFGGFRLLCNDRSESMENEDAGVDLRKI